MSTAEASAHEAPVLVACGHGTRSPAGRRATAQLRLAIQALRPGLEVLAASVDVQKPALPEVLRRLGEQGRRSVVVPLLLSAGYHVYVDVQQAVESAHGTATAAAALGPDDALVELLTRRLTEAGTRDDDAVVLAAAGSSDPRALADVEQVALGLAARRGAPVTAAYLSAATPAVAQAVSQARRSAPRVAVATYLLAPGFFVDRLGQVGADLVTAPLAPDPVLARLALQRYDHALKGSD